MSDIRYYMGRHKVKIIECLDKKSICQHLEFGKVGNEKIGYKIAYPGELDIAPTRMLRLNKKSPCSSVGRVRGVRTRGTGVRDPPRASNILKFNEKGSEK